MRKPTWSMTKTPPSPGPAHIPKRYRQFLSFSTSLKWLTALSPAYKLATTIRKDSAP